ncbi:hypothetical protein MAALD49_31470 [Marinobacter shengliensis]|nr:hypothetical protein MAALD49_31470 [Marinobacter shengliensis]
MLLVTVLWAICFPFIVVGLPDAPPLLFAALRALLAGICLVLIALARGGRVRYSPRRFFLLTAIGFSYTGMGLGGMFLGAGELGPGLATVLANAQPLFAAVLSYFFIREVVSGRLFAGLLIGFIGVVVLAAPDMEVSNSRFIGSVYILGGAVGTAIGNVLLKYQAGSDDIYWSMGIQLVIGSVFLGFASVILGEGMDINWTWSFATAALVLSIPATALMVVLWYALLASAPLNSLNSFTFLTPALGVVIGQLWFGETFSVVEIIGISITIFGLIIVMKAPGEGGRVREVRPGID